MPSKSEPIKSVKSVYRPKDEPVLELNGQFFPVKDLPQHVTDLLTLFTAWEVEKTVAVREVQKLDAAMKSLSQEISTRMAIWQAQQAAQSTRIDGGIDGGVPGANVDGYNAADN